MHVSVCVLCSCVVLQDIGILIVLSCHLTWIKLVHVRCCANDPNLFVALF